MAGLGNKHLYLPLSGILTVFGIYRPSIFLIDEYFMCSHIDHRFDGEHHARHEEHPFTLATEMRHIGLFVVI